MAKTVNSRFLAIGSGEPNINTGWTIRVLDYKDKKSLIAVMTEFSEFSFTQELNGTGTGSVTLDEDSPWWTDILSNGLSHRAIQNREYIFEAWDNNTPRFAWLGQNVINTPVSEDETRTVTISGPGLAQSLARAKVYRPGWPNKVPVISTTTSTADPTVTYKNYRESSYNDLLPAFKWRFPTNWSTMRMWYTLFRAAQRRGAIPWVTPMFTALKDSAKHDFLYIKTLETSAQIGYQPEDPDTSLLDFLNDCTGQDYTVWFGQRLEWIMYPGFKLDVRQHIGTDRSKTVRFFQGNILSDERTRDREEIYTRINVLNNNNLEIIRTDKAGVAAWDIREQWNTAQKTVTNTNILNQIADRMLAQHKDEKDQWSIKIPYDDPGRVPYRNFYVGDHIGFNVDYFGSTPTATSAPAAMRVMAITISLSSESTVPDCELTLQSIIESKQVQLQRQVTELSNKAKILELNDLANVDTSGATEGSTLVYDPASGTYVSGTSGTSGSGGGGTGRVFMQNVDPATQSGVTVTAGDFWLETYD